MIERHTFFFPETRADSSKELALLSIITQSFFQPFSLEDNLLVILTALTSGSGVGFNRAMLFLKEGEKLKAKMWLGPGSAPEARSIWEVLSTPGIGYIEIIEYNRSLLRRNQDALSKKIGGRSYSLEDPKLLIPALAARTKDIILVRNARTEPLVDPWFRDVMGVDDFLCLPLLAQDEIVGEIILDNAITRAPIDIKDIKLASICGLIAGNYVYSANLHNKLVNMEKMAALGEMAVFITHQLRNPLVTIGGFTEQLLNPDIDEKKRRRNLLIIRDEIQRLEDIVYQIGHFLKVSAQELVPFHIQPVLESVLQSPEIQSQSQGITLNVKIAKCPYQVLCDPTYVGEIFRNVLENSLQATPPGATISIRAYPKSSKWFVISIKDTGKGISDMNKRMLFRPFFTTKENGMGLGLAFVKRVMDSCGGRIEVESKEGKGTLVRLYFQCQERSKPDEKDSPR